MTGSHFDGRLSGLLRGQAGVVAHAQLVELGITTKVARRLKRGWFPMGPGVYCAVEPIWESWCWAGVLYAGSTAAVGGRAAAHVLGLSVEPPSLITIWHRRSSQLVRLGGAGPEVRFRRGERGSRGSLPRTHPEVTLLDASGESDENEIISLTARALSQGLTTPDRLSDALASRSRGSHRSILEELCSVAGTGVESVLEWRFLQKVIRAHGLPEPDRQVCLVPGTRSDCHWDTYGVVAELDGETWHKDVFRDMDKDNRIALTGRLSLHYGWYDANFRPCGAAEQLRQAFSLKGFTDELTPCPGCRHRRWAPSLGTSRPELGS